MEINIVDKNNKLVASLEELKLKDFQTCDLVRELSKRKGVEKITIEPYEKINIQSEGPIIILRIID